MLFNKEKYVFNLSEFFRNRTKSLIIPYLKYSIYILLFYILIYQNTVDKSLILKNFIGIFMCLRYTDYSGFLWFIIGLFNIQIIMILLYRILKDDYKVLFLSLILSLITVWIIDDTKIALPLYLDLSIVNLFYFCLGNYLKDNLLISKLNSWILFLIFVVSINLNLTFFTSSIDIYWNMFGNNILFLISGVSATIFIIKIFSKFNCYKNIPLLFIGQNTNIIYCLHQIIILPIAKYICSILFLDKIFVNIHVMFYITVSVSCIIIITIYAYIKKRISTKNNRCLIFISNLM